MNPQISSSFRNPVLNFLNLLAVERYFVIRNTCSVNVREPKHHDSGSKTSLQHIQIQTSIHIFNIYTHTSIHNAKETSIHIFNKEPSSRPGSQSSLVLDLFEHINIFVFLIESLTGTRNYSIPVNFSILWLLLLRSWQDVFKSIRANRNAAVRIGRKNKRRF